MAAGSSGGSAKLAATEGVGKRSRARDRTDRSTGQRLESDRLTAARALLGAAPLPQGNLASVMAQSFRVLLVEDDDSLRSCLGEFLASQGIQAAGPAQSAPAEKEMGPS